MEAQLIEIKMSVAELQFSKEEAVLEAKGARKELKKLKKKVRPAA